MKLTDISFLAKACEGKLLGNKELKISGVKIDSRSCGSGDLFICIVGARSDGHDYIEKAYEQGCRAFLVTREVKLPEDAACILVEDSYKAATMMAAKYLEQFDLIKIGITGSVGKTTTKEICAAVMSAKYKTVCSHGNQNAGYGLVLTCFRAEEDTQCLVIEEGMDRMHELSDAASWLKLDLAVITNVGVSHMETLGSRDAIAFAKLEITEALSDDGVLVVNAASDYLKTEDEIRRTASNKGNYRIVRVGKDISYKDLKNKGGDGIQFYVNNAEFSIPLLGEHIAQDVCLAVAAGLNFGISEEAAAQALKSIRPTDRRLKADHIGSIVLIDDSYNASPESMKAGLAALAGIEADRHIAVLGDMLELGGAEVSGHIDVGRYAADLGTDILIATGNKKEYYFKGVSQSSNSATSTIGFDSLESVKDMVLQLLKPGDAVLVKGSNSTRLSEVAELIRTSGKELF